MGTVAGYRMNVFQLSSTMTVAKPVVRSARIGEPSPHNRLCGAIRGFDLGPCFFSLLARETAAGRIDWPQGVHDKT